MSVQVSLPARTDLDEITGPTGATGPQGESGSALYVGAFVNLSTMTIPSGTNRIKFSGYYTENDGGGFEAEVFDTVAEPTYIAANPYISGTCRNGRSFRHDDMFPEPHQFGIKAADGLNYALRLQAFMDWIEGGAGWWRGDGGAIVTTGRVYPPSNAYLWMDGDVVVNGLSGQTNVLRFSNISDFTLESCGATFFNPTTATSATWYFEGATDIHVKGVRVGGGGPTKDAIYIGMSGTVPCAGIYFDDVVGYDSPRNCMSIAGCIGGFFDNCEFYGAIAAPGAGVDSEANNFYNVAHIRFRNLYCHDNGGVGFVNVFGHDVQVDGFRGGNNQGGDLGCGAGGAQFDVGKRRSGIDVIAVTAINTATGEITVATPDNLPVGAWLLWSTRNGATKPTGYNSAVRWCVASKPNTNTVILATDPTAPVTSLADAGTLGTGAFDPDPEVSAMYFTVYAPGQCSELHFREVEVDGTSASPSISIATSVGLSLKFSRRLTAGIDKGCIIASYTRKIELDDVYVTGSLSSTSSAATGISITSCSQLTLRKTMAENCGYAGVIVKAIFDLRTVIEPIAINCGWLAASAGAMQFGQIVTMTSYGGRTLNDPNWPSTKGFNCNPSNTITNLTMVGFDATSSGSSDANSLSVPAGAQLINCIRKSGTLYNGYGGSQQGVTLSSSTATAQNLRPGTEKERTKFTGNLTADATVTVSTTSAVSGKTRFYVERTGTGAFQMIFAQTGGTVLCALGTGEWAVFEFDGTNYYVEERGRVTDPVKTVSTNADLTATMHTDGRNYLHTGTLTADRTVTLSTTNANAGDIMTFTRTGSGAFNLIIGSLKNLATSTWCDVIFDGSAWKLYRYGTL